LDRLPQDQIIGTGLLKGTKGLNELEKYIYYLIIKEFRKIMKKKNKTT
jgi:hypothetical protein